MSLPVSRGAPVNVMLGPDKQCYAISKYNHRTYICVCIFVNAPAH